ncbi:hypothetical protein Q7O_004522 [Pectobacterium carotovorum subsp. carotovorum PCCS1]|nr:hypothetical protein [Pectobacterium carotovorum subsp. carotovorum PCCS1]
MWLCTNPIAANRIFFIFRPADTITPNDYNKVEIEQAKDKSRVTR